MFQPSRCAIGLIQSLHLGRLTVANKPGRLDKMRNMLLDIKRKGKITKADAQTVQGLLNYTRGFFLGSSCRMATRCFSNLISEFRAMNSPLYAISLLPVWRRQPRDRGPAQCMTATLWSSLMALLKWSWSLGSRCLG